MQNNEVKAFRQRLIRGGFTDISIYDCGYGEYSVQCRDSAGNMIRRRMTIEKMINIPKLVYFD